MAFPDHNWTITHNANKSYTVSCSNFIEQTKSITLTTANKNFTGDVSINITCANCGDKSASGIASSSSVAVDTLYPYPSTYKVFASGTMRVNIAESGWIQKGDYELSYDPYYIGTIDKGTTPYLIGNSETSEVGLTNSSINYITVSNSETITVAGAPTGYYLANTINNNYSIDSHSVGKITKNNLKSVAYISDSRIGGSNARNLAMLYPDSIYVVLNDSTDFYSGQTGSDVIWSKPSSWEGGSIVWFDEPYWRIKSHDETGAIYTAYCGPDPGQTYKTCYLDANNYIRRIRIANRVTSGISTVDESISNDGARIRVTSEYL